MILISKTNLILSCWWRRSARINNKQCKHFDGRCCWSLEHWSINRVSAFKKDGIHSETRWYLDITFVDKKQEKNNAWAWLIVEVSSSIITTPDYTLRKWLRINWNSWNGKSYCIHRSPNIASSNYYFFSVITKRFKFWEILQEFFYGGYQKSHHRVL